VLHDRRNERDLLDRQLQRVGAGESSVLVVRGEAGVGKTALLGYVAEEAFFFGGGGYWMATDRSHSRELAYGGFVMQWFVLNSDRFGVSGKVLLGGGEATTPQVVTQVVGLPSPSELNQLTQAQYNVLVRAHTVTSTIGVRQDFFVAEPEINARLALAKHLRLTFGAGYRFAGDGWWWHYYGGHHNDRVSGAVGTFGVQIGG
jgi:hypothetical protein